MGNVACSITDVVAAPNTAVLILSTLRFTMCEGVTLSATASTFVLSRRRVSSISARRASGVLRHRVSSVFGFKAGGISLTVSAVCGMPLMVLSSLRPLAAKTAATMPPQMTATITADHPKPTS